MSKKSQKSDWWIKILTTEPVCVYYFEAFTSYSGAEIVNYKIEQGKPKQLTMDLR